MVSHIEVRDSSHGHLSLGKMEKGRDAFPELFALRRMRFLVDFDWLRCVYKMLIDFFNVSVRFRGVV